jgi:hypothetical protein
MKVLLLNLLYRQSLWNKSSPQIRNKKKTGKYLSSTQTKLKFKPVTMKGMANSNAKEKLNCSSNEFKEFERISSGIA